MGEFILASIAFIISIAMFVISFRSFKEKGFLFNNAYIYASKEERETMDRKPHYKQSAIVFLMLGIVFLLIAAEIIWETGWLFYVEMLCIAIVLIYAVVSSIKMSRKN